MANLQSTAVIQRSASQFIYSALRKVGALRSGQNLSAAELTDSLQVANDMLDAWSASRLMIWVVQRIINDQNGVQLSLQASKQTYRLGNASNAEEFLLPRPPRLERVSVIYPVSSPTVNEITMDMYDDVKWQGVPNKNTTSLLPQICYVELSADGTDYLISFWPIPTQANPVALYAWSGLGQFPNLNTKFFFPPAYARAISFNLAVDLAVEFGTDMTKFPVVMKEAQKSRATIESMNLPMKEAVCDPYLIGAGGPRGNIYAGAPSRSHGQ